MDIPYVSRHGEVEIRRFIADGTPHKPVLLLEGARQVGKTRLVERVLQESGRPVTQVNLERDALTRSAFDDCREFAEFTDLLRDRFDFVADAGQVLFIDEAQESRMLGSFVRFMKEEWRSATVILSGSTLTRLFRPHTRYPVGRVRRFILGPFSFSEFLAGAEPATSRGTGAVWRQQRQRAHKPDLRTTGELVSDPALRSEGTEPPGQPRLSAQAVPVRHRRPARTAPSRPSAR